MQRISSKDEFIGRTVGLEYYRPGDASTKTLSIGISSGTTTGTPTLVIHNREYGAPGTNFLHKTHIYGKGHAMLRLSRSAQSTQRMLTEIWRVRKPDRLLPITKRDVDAAYFADIVHAFVPTQLQAPPSMAVYMLNTLYEQQAFETLDLLKERVTALDFSAEKMTDSHRDIIRAFLPKATFYSHYGLTEVPYWVAMTCPVDPDPDTSVHCVPEHFTDAVEILDPNEDGTGEITIATRELGRYRTGDRGKIEAQQCPCGSTKKLIVLGRVDYDIIECVGATFLLDEVDRVFGSLKDFVSDYLVEVSEEADQTTTKLRGRLHVTVVPTEHLRKDPLAESMIRQAFEKQFFATPSRTLAQLVEQDIFLPTRVTLADTIERRSKKIRLRRI